MRGSPIVAKGFQGAVCLVWGEFESLDRMELYIAFYKFHVSNEVLNQESPNR